MQDSVAKLRRSAGLVRLLVLLAVAGFGCATGPETRPRVSYRVSAKENFLKGKKAFEDEDYLEAIEYFKFVKNKFPYSAYASQADLLLADCQFGRERYIEAADAYTNFIKLHPRNPKVPYAAFRIGECYYQRIPTSWWLLPPAFELDQSETQRATRELESYLQRYPDDENAPRARKLLADCKRRLAERVHFVMRFNRKIEQPRGALWRAEELLQQYPGAGFDEEALMVKAESLVDLGEPSQARGALAELIARFPKGDYASDARDLLAKLPAAPAAKQPAGQPAEQPAEQPAKKGAGGGK